MVKKNCDNMLSRFHLIPERYGQTDRGTDRFAISISRVKNAFVFFLIKHVVAFYPHAQYVRVKIEAQNVG